MKTKKALLDVVYGQGRAVRNLTAMNHTEAPPERPQVLKVKSSGIPESLKKEHPYWAVWKLEPPEKEGGKPKKPPKDPKTKRNLSRNTPAEISFETALKAYKTGEWDGISLSVKGDENSFFAPLYYLEAIDLDGVRDPETGKLTKTARRILNAAEEEIKSGTRGPEEGQGQRYRYEVPYRSYVEISPSGTGLRLVFKGRSLGFLNRGHDYTKFDLPDGGSIEAFLKSGYVSITGRRLKRSADDIRPASKPLLELLRKLKREAKSQSASYSFGDGSSSSVDQQAIHKALVQGMTPQEEKGLGRLREEIQSDSGLSALWDGDAGGYSSVSEADFAFCSKLAWKRATPAQIEALWFESALGQRGKVQGFGYRRITIINAYRNVPDHISKAPKLGSSSQPAGGKKPKRFNHTDMGNAKRFIAVATGPESILLVRYYHERKCWIVRDGAKWVPDLTSERIQPWVEKTIDNIWGDVAKAKDKDDRKKKISFAFHSESRHAIQNMLDIARRIPDVPVLAEQLDNDPWMLGVPNGVLDLQKGQLTQPGPRLMITKSLSVPYDPDAKCPRWKKFLREICGGDRELVLYIQRIAGYCLTGSTKERCFFLLWGRGRNGKSTLLAVFQMLMGDYAAVLNVESLLERKYANIPEDLADARGARFAFASESDAGRRLNTARVKALTGSDMIRARRLHENGVSFRPQFKLFLATNHLPQVSSSDEALWDRIMLLPFTQRFEGKQEDRNLGEKLKAELPGILAWAVRGCLSWQKKGLQPPKAARRAVKSYREDMDLVGQFLKDCTVPEEGEHVTSLKLFATYQGWCDGRGEQAGTQRQLGMAMTDRGFQRKMISRQTCYLGLRLRTDKDSSQAKGTGRSKIRKDVNFRQPV